MNSLKIIDGTDDFIHECIDRFGHMNKKDYEVALFHLLLRNGFDSLSDFSVSRKLRIPEGRVRSLRYETDLVYNSGKDPNLYKQEFYQILKNGTFKPTNDNKMQFAVKNKMLRLYILDKLESYGSFADSSFNSNIVVVTAGDILILLADFEQKEQLQKDIKEQLKQQGKLLPKNLSKRLLEGLKAVTKDVAKLIAPNVSEWLSDWLESK